MVLFCFLISPHLLRIRPVFTLIQSFIHVFVCRTDCESPTSFSCSYPVANISLMRNKKHVCMDVCLYVSVSVCVLNIHVFIEELSNLLKMHIQVLTFGQAYRISLQLEMPDSPANRDLGMFMIRTACFSRDGSQVASSARSVSCTNACSASIK